MVIALKIAASAVSEDAESNEKITEVQAKTRENAVSCLMPLQASSPATMDQFEGFPVTETLQKISAQLGCSPTAAEVAAFLDKHDQLRHLRENFLVPQIQDLPPCELDKRKSMLRTCKRHEQI